MSLEISSKLGLSVWNIREHKDDRGLFLESFKSSIFSQQTQDVRISQVNVSMSKFGVLRGLHGIASTSFGSKFVTCLKGRILDVVVDVRPDSINYGEYEFFEISNEGRIVIHVPSGFAHGFLALEDETLVCYAQDFEYDEKLEYAINAFDPQINILWPLGIDFLQSKKDSEAQSLSEFGDQFPNRFQ